MDSGNSQEKYVSPAPRKRIRRALRTGAVYLAWVAVSLGVVEAALRFGLGLGNPVLIAPDAACMYTLKPDQDVFRFFARTHINHYGMRSDEIPPYRDPHTLRVLFVGDSIAYGTSRVDQREIFTEILRRDLPSIVHSPVEVLNASASGWAIDNELAYVRTRGTFQSNLVLLVLNSGDLSQRRSTIADVENLLLQVRPSTAIGELYMRVVKPYLSRAGAKTDPGDRADQNADDVVRGNLSKLDDFQAFASGQGTRLVIVYVPFRGDIPNGSDHWLSLLSSWSLSRHVTLLDLTPVEAHYSVEEITLDHGVHLNAKGNLAVAKGIERLWPKLPGW